MSSTAISGRKRGDRRDGTWVKDAPGLNVLMASLYPNRTDCEVYLNEEIDVTELLKYIEEKNGAKDACRLTLFHCFVAMMARLLTERPYLNRFIQGRRIYQRNQITISFVAKRKFADHSEEALMQYIAKGSDTLADISRFIVGMSIKCAVRILPQASTRPLTKSAICPGFC